MRGGQAGMACRRADRDKTGARKPGRLQRQHVRPARRRRDRPHDEARDPPGRQGAGNPGSSGPSPSSWGAPVTGRVERSRCESRPRRFRSLPPVQEVAYLQLGDFPLDDPDWDVGIQEVYALPYYATYDLQPWPLDFPVMYHRIPKGEAEIRRASGVYSRRGTPPRTRGRLPGRSRRAHHTPRPRARAPLGPARRHDPHRRRREGRDRRRELSLTTEQVGSLPEAAVRRWPTRSRHGR